MRLHDINRSELYWNRCFCAKLSSEQKIKYNIDDIKPLTEKETEKLLKIIHSHLRRLEIPIDETQDFYSIERIEFQDYPNLKDMIWESDMDYDFRKFIFPMEIDFTGNTFHEVTDFREAIFLKTVDFSNASFLSSVIFKKTRFKDVLFHSTKFEGSADFWNAHFLDINDFAKSQFKGGVDLNFTTFKRIASFSGACFRKDITFYDAELSEGARFDNAQFLGNNDFQNTRFLEKASFYRAQFSGHSEFLHAYLKKGGSFDSAQFKEKSTVRFDGMTCKGEFNFSNVDCHPRCFFTGANFKDAHLECANTHFRSGIEMGKVVFPLSINSLNDQSKVGDALSTWRKIKNLAIQDNDTHLQLNAQSIEFQVRQQDENEEWIVRLMIAAYGLLADYGLSVFKPVISLLIVFVGFFMIHTLLTGWPLTAWLFIVFPVCLPVYCYVHNHIVAITKFCNHKITLLISELSKIKAKVRSCQRSISRTIYRILVCRFCQQKYRHLKNMLYKNRENLWKITGIGLVFIIFICLFNYELYSAALEMSFYDTTTFLKLSTTASSIFDKLYDQADGLYYVIIMFVRMMHKIILIALLALLANSIRNHLRMR